MLQFFHISNISHISHIFHIFHIVGILIGDLIDNLLLVSILFTWTYTPWLIHPGCINGLYFIELMLSYVRRILFLHKKWTRRMDRKSDFWFILPVHYFRVFLRNMSCNTRALYL